MPFARGEASEVVGALAPMLARGRGIIALGIVRWGAEEEFERAIDGLVASAGLEADGVVRLHWAGGQAVRDALVALNRERDLFLASGRLAVLTARDEAGLAALKAAAFDFVSAPDLDFVAELPLDDIKWEDVEAQLRWIVENRAARCDFSAMVGYMGRTNFHVDEVYLDLANPVPPGDGPLYVIGGAGAGKTTLMRRWAVDYASRRADPLGVGPLAPVIVSANAFARMRADVSATLEFASFLERWGDEVAREARRFRGEPCRHLPRYAFRLLFLVDGLDEVPGAAERAGIHQALLAFVRAHRPGGLVVTGRSLQLASILDQEDAPRVMALREPTSSERAELLRCYYRARWQSDDSSGELDHTVRRWTQARRHILAMPLHVLLAVNLMERGAFAESVPDLYWQATEWIERVTMAPSLDQRRRGVLLGALRWFCAQPAGEVRRDALREEVHRQAALAGLDPESTSILAFKLSRMVVFGSVEGDRLRPIHQTVVQYLVGAWDGAWAFLDDPLNPDHFGVVRALVAAGARREFHTLHTWYLGRPAEAVQRVAQPALASALLRDVSPVAERSAWRSVLSLLIQSVFLPSWGEWTGCVATQALMDLAEVARGPMREDLGAHVGDRLTGPLHPPLARRLGPIARALDLPTEPLITRLLASSNPALRAAGWENRLRLAAPEDRPSVLSDWERNEPSERIAIIRPFALGLGGDPDYLPA